MSSGSFVFMLLSLLISWGGFAFFLSIALRKKK